jgi:hypothetical protein
MNANATYHRIRIRQHILQSIYETILYTNSRGKIKNFCDTNSGRFTNVRIFIGEGLFQWFEKVIEDFFYAETAHGTNSE